MLSSFCMMGLYPKKDQQKENLLQGAKQKMWKGSRRGGLTKKKVLSKVFQTKGLFSLLPSHFYILNSGFTNYTTLNRITCHGRINQEQTYEVPDCNVKIYKNNQNPRMLIRILLFLRTRFLTRKGVYLFRPNMHSTLFYQMLFFLNFKLKYKKIVQIIVLLDTQINKSITYALLKQAHVNYFCLYLYS